MAKLNMVIADSDVEYLESLWRYLQMSKSSQIVLSHKFTTLESLDSFLSQRQRTDLQDINVLLVKPDLLPLKYTSQKSQDNLKIDVVLLLTDNPQEANEYAFPQVYKYLTADALIDNVIDLYLRKKQASHGSLRGYQSTECMAVFSPSAGAGKTTIALALAKSLGQIGKRVFYLNLESNSCLGTILPSKGLMSISKLLVYIQDEQGEPLQTAQKLTDSILHSDEIRCDYIPAFDKSFDIADLTVDNVAFIIKTILEIGTYSYLIVDLESSLNRRTLAVLEEICHRYIWVHGALGDKFHKSKSKQLEADIDNLSFERVKKYSDKCIPVINRYYYGETEILGHPVILKIPNAKNIFNFDDGFVQSDESVGFWRGISGLVSVVLKQD